ncbi:unnamed protein product [Ranitomeya imitator]|uniref:Uncharacterized protein n=1 Tax=Ranitomeya imitator TaxID=111125 RepID=A0ABN9L6L5_9NEOB|nr:unnamed protein product [Ranitomeya imitator]
MQRMEPPYESKFKKGALVMIKTFRKSGPWESNWEGPFEIIETMGQVMILVQRASNEEMDSNKSWNMKHHVLDGRESTPILQEKTFPRKSYYLMGITFLLLCTISTVIYVEDILHRGTNTSEVNEPFERTLHSMKPRGSSLQNLIDEDVPDNSVDITGNICIGYDNPSPKDSGLYQCCVLTKNNYKQCKDVNVNIWSAIDNVCTQTRFQPSTPFQINQFQSKPLLQDGVFMTMIWTFNMSNWKISSRYPQCQSHLINMEMGIEQWFGKRTPAQVRS